MKKVGLVILMIGLSFSLFAQSGKLSDEKRKEFEAQKIAFFTQEMELTPEEAAVFWPLYNEMQQKLRVENDKIRNLTCKKAKDTPVVTEEQAKKNLKTVLDAEQTVWTIKKKYTDKLLKVLPAKKVWLMFEAEQKFRHQLWKKMENKPAPGQK